MADASTWADENSRDIPGSAAWHFVNVPISTPHATRSATATTTASSRGSRSSASVLADPGAPRPRRRMALRYVVHLVEDAHQPMHVGDNRDRGGNNVQLQFFRDEYTNLHQVWDSGLLRIGYRSERELVDDLIDLARRPEARDWTKGTRRGLGQREPRGRPPGLSDSRLASVRPTACGWAASTRTPTSRWPSSGSRRRASGFPKCSTRPSPRREKSIPAPHFRKDGCPAASPHARGRGAR